MLETGITLEELWSHLPPTLCRGWIPGLSGSQGAKSNRSAVFVFSLLFFTQTDSDPSRGMFLLEAMDGYMTHTQAQIQAHVHLRRYACTCKCSHSIL